MERRIGDSEAPGIRSIQQRARTLMLSSGRSVQVFIQCQTEVALPPEPNRVAPRPRCILVHGNPGTMSDWVRVLQPLAEHADVAALDLPGFGMSPLPETGRSELTLEHFASDVVGVADTLGWTDPFYIIGHSHGGAIALAASVARPNRVAGVIAVGTLGIRSARSYRQLEQPTSRFVYRLGASVFRSPRLKWVAKNLLRRALATVYAPNAVSKAAVEHQYAQLSQRPETLQRMLDLATTRPSDFLAQKVVPNVSCPVMMIHGDADRLVPIEHARSTYRAITKSGTRGELVVLEGAGHMIPVCNAQRLLQAVIPFVTAY